VKSVICEFIPWILFLVLSFSYAPLYTGITTGGNAINLISISETYQGFVDP
jgi:hypothetical protein